MDRIPRSTQALFATGLIGVGLVGLWFGNFAGIAQEIPAWVPAHAAIVYASAVLLILGGIGLFVDRAAAGAARLIFCLVGLWVALLLLPIALRAPLVLGSWSNMAEIVVLLAGAWVLFATLAGSAARPSGSFPAGPSGVLFAQLLFGVALPPLGLAHIVYLNLTAPLVPAWLPYHTFWAYSTGVAQIVAGLAVLLSIRARLAATLEAAMLSAFTVLVWIPLLVAKPSAPFLWSEITISWAISAAAFVVAASVPRSHAAAEHA